MVHELIIIILLSVFIAIIRKRNLSTIIDVEIKGLALFVASFLLQSVSVFVVNDLPDTGIGLLIGSYFPIIYCISYQLILIGIVLNIEKKYMKILFIGTMLNFLVILFNGMKMPVKIPQDYEYAWENYSYLMYGKDLIHSALTSNTKLKFLADIINLREPYPFNKTISIGDLFLLFGAASFVQMESNKSPKTG